MAKIYGDRWKVTKSLAEGGQAHVFLVVDQTGEDQPRGVLKRLKNLNRLPRFKAEIEAVRVLSHENILRFIDYELDGDQPYLVTEYCNGGSLAQAKEWWHGNVGRIFEVFGQVCDAVAFAHARGIIHRDLKPDNVFMRTDHGPAVVGDFGLCFVDSKGTRFTMTEEAVGSIRFMAPELEDGRLVPITEKSDVYSLGKLLYWLLSGGKSFSREKHRERRWDLKGENHDSLLGWNNIYMEHANRLLDLMLAPDPDDRRDVANIIILARRVRRLIEKEYAPIDKGIRHPCTYCGEGHYVLSAKNHREVSNFGMQPVGNPDWRILTCSSCGHVQMFRIENAEQKERW